MAGTKKNEQVQSLVPGTKTYYTRNNLNPTNTSEADTALQNVISKAPGAYQAGEGVQNAYNQLQNTINSKPGEYQSNYSDQMKNLLGNILNREDFSYDFNADPLYQNYKNQYTQAGKQAMQDTQAAASALTGGYGNSYATGAASQAYQQYLTQLNNKIPELYNMALQKYQMDSDNMYRQYNAVGAQEDREYGQYRDSVSDWQNDRNYALNQYGTLYNQDYGAYRDQVNDYYTDRNYYAGRSDSLYNREQDERQMAYQQYRDSISDSQWQQSFDYNKERDAVSDSQWKQSFDYNKDRDTVSDSQWQQSFDYNKDRDAVSDSQWQQSFDYNKERDAVSDSQWQQNFELSKQKAANSSASRSSSGSTSNSTGKKLTTEVKSQLKDLEGSELADYCDYITENGGFSSEAVYDYLLQMNKLDSVLEEEDRKTQKNSRFQKDWEEYRKNVSTGNWGAWKH